ncbi:MAG: hypothetical protein Q8L39_11885 [Burkholderiales bacterium]|nr:hypothetical protein [Burkholderiales bacterium]
MRFTLLIPDLLPPQPPGGMLDLYHGLHLPDLEWLFARGTLQGSPGLSLEAWLLKRFGIDDTQPVASFSLLADGGVPGITYWLRADPVHLQAQRDQLALVDGAMLAITATEASALTESLNQHFSQDSLKFIPTHPTRLYLALGAAPDLVTHALPTVAGKSINSCLPSGAEGLRWNQIATEIQMLLHVHPVNQARETQGQPTINSVWFWGGGVCPSLGMPAMPEEQIWANDALARGLALAAKQTPQALPLNFDAFMAQANTTSAHCVLWDELRRAAWYGDHDAWRMGLMRLEADWIKPLCYALRRGIVSEVTLHAISEQGCLAVTTNRSGRWQFWRRPKALKHYSSEMQAA